jgi:Flp pilus assembly protein TadG
VIFLRLVRKLIKNKKGQALVELALILPILIMIILATMEFGRVFYSYLVITNASREGARAGVVGTDDYGIKTKVKNAATTLPLTDSQITITPSQGSRPRGAPLTVQVNYSVTLVAPIPNVVVPNPFPLTATTTMRVE